MKCPNCNTALVMTDRSGIEIDYCPDCRSVWLDHGELDKIIERSMQNVPNSQQNNFYDKEHYHSGKDYPYKKKKGLFGELFDF
jgi:Zn-finger nucleic acid-binding protein